MATVQLGSQNLSLDTSVLAARPALLNYEGRRVVLGIRPEDFEDATMVTNHREHESLTAPVTLTAPVNLVDHSGRS